MLNALLPFLPLLASLIPLGQAATADEWRSRSVYQLLTDRFAPATEGAACDTDDRVYCGGSFNTIASKLDYIQGMGYDAIWISPTGLNLEGTTIYGEAYHGFWTTDPTQINPHFGTSDDLKALSKAVHDRGMFLMVDIAINAFASTSNDISQAGLDADANKPLLFKNTADYHPPCDIKWGNQTSEQQCWLANYGVYLMDLAQETSEVGDTLKSWVPGYVSEYGIDGFRIDASKHMTKSFQHDFCSAAGTFCIGEVAGDNTAYAASYMGSDGIDSVFGFGMQNGFIKCFTGPSPSSMSTLADYISQATAYPDASVVGAFLDNQDLPRINSLESDKTKVYNAIVGTFIYGGIPTVYYGLEQDIADGDSDPHNREALWLYNNYATGQTYQRIAKLNEIRKKLGASNADWSKAAGTTLSSQQNDIAIQRSNSLIVLTNRGSGATGSWNIPNAGFGNDASVIDLLTCNTSTVGSDGSLTVTWTSGEPFVFVAQSTANSAGLCGSSTSSSSKSSSRTSTSATASATASPSGSTSPSSSASGAATTSQDSQTSDLASAQESQVATMSSDASTGSPTAASTAVSTRTGAALIVDGASTSLYSADSSEATATKSLAANSNATDSGSVTTSPDTTVVVTSGITGSSTSRAAASSIVASAGSSETGAGMRHGTSATFALASLVLGLFLVM